MSVESASSLALPPSASAVLTALAEGRLTAQALVDSLLESIAAAGSEGERAYLSVDAEGARTAARTADRLRNDGKAGPLAGLPVAVKDLFDIAGQVTTAGSRVLADAPAAEADAAMVARLRQAGAVVLGRTHMNEFAFSALGTNPHFAQPRSPWQREIDVGRGRSPGGSTSGGAVAVADGLAYATLGSDTGGSTRIPAAFCGLIGWRPSQGRMPGDGAFPLAASFDTPGLIVRTAEDCRLLDAVLTGAGADDVAVPPLSALRFGRADGMPFEDLAPEIAMAIAAALDRLTGSGARIDAFGDFDWAAPATALRAGQITAVEGLVAHGALFDQHDRYDQRVIVRMRAGETIPATDYVRAKRHIAALRRQFDAAAEGFDAILMPTVAILPPRLAELDDDETFFALNAAALRNTLIASILDLPAISLPISDPGQPPVGLMMIGRRGADRKLLAAAQAVETVLHRLWRN